MKRRNSQAWLRNLGIFLLASMSFAGTMTRPGKDFLDSAGNVVWYYRALENAEVPTGLWARIAYSLVLATADSPRSKKPCLRPTSSS